MMWDAAQYQKFSDERSRPFFDLLAQVHVEQPRQIADLGCGAGKLTRTLAERWPQAHVIGVDNSPAMLAEAAPLAIASRLEFVQADLATWSSAVPLDLLVSNAALHWVLDHAGLLARLKSLLAPAGTLAVQMPNRFHTPSQRAIDETLAESRWAARLQGVGLKPEAVMSSAWYVEQLRALGFDVNAWETTYIHQLHGDDPVLEWLRGTALRPVLARLDRDEARAFEAALAARLRAAYPARNGITLFPFPRLFFVATLIGGQRKHG